MSQLLDSFPVPTHPLSGNDFFIANLWRDKQNDRNKAMNFDVICAQRVQVVTRIREQPRSGGNKWLGATAGWEKYRKYQAVMSDPYGNHVFTINGGGMNNTAELCDWNDHRTGLCEGSGHSLRVEMPGGFKISIQSGEKFWGPANIVHSTGTVVGTVRAPGMREAKKIMGNSLRLIDPSSLFNPFYSWDWRIQLTHNLTVRERYMLIAALTADSIREG